MSYLMQIIREIDPSWQAMIEEIEKATTLSLILRAAWHLAYTLVVDLVESELTKRARQKTVWENCPRCGRRLQSKGFEPRQITSLLGIIRWRRRVGRCPQRCRIGQIAPLDKELGLAPNQKTDGRLKQMACLLSVFVPFATATELLQQLTGAQVSSGSIWQWVQQAGERMADWLDQELQALAKGQLPEMEEMTEEMLRQTLVIGADGVMVPFRPQKGSRKGKTVWREVKVGILARLKQHRNRAGELIFRLEQRRLVALLGDINAFSRRLWLEALRQGISSSPQVVWLSDGARGFWGLFDRRFALYAYGVLDFYHASQNLWRGVKVWLDGRTRQARAWFDDARHRLRHGDENAVLEDIAAALNLPDLPESARVSLTKLYNYLDKHREHIHYEQLKAMGLPIGSGLVESACKWLIQQRFKGVGMRWSEEGFNHLLHLRLAWVNGRFDALFEAELTSPKS